MTHDPAITLAIERLQGFADCTDIWLTYHGFAHPMQTMAGDLRKVLPLLLASAQPVNEAANAQRLETATARIRGLEALVRELGRKDANVLTDTVHMTDDGAKAFAQKAAAAARDGQRVREVRKPGLRPINGNREKLAVIDRVAEAIYASIFDDRLDPAGTIERDIYRNAATGALMAGVAAWRGL